MIRAGLDKHDHQILSLLSTDGGFCTGSIASKVEVFPGSNRINSAWVRRRLVRLAKIGYVAPLDDKKPVAWRLTELGNSFSIPLPEAPALSGERR